VDLTIAKRAEIGTRDVVDFKMTAILNRAGVDTSAVTVETVAPQGEAR
jgi:hypothetical protein